MDGLRGVAILAVLAFHWIAVPLRAEHPELRWLLHPLASGVDVFFVVSGYLIGGILLRHCQTPGFAPVFLLRRALRIVPLYLLSVVVFVGLHRVSDGSPAGLTPTWTFFAFLDNFYYGDASTPLFELNPYWSLAIEAQFYLTGLLAVVLFGRRGLFGYALLAIAVGVCFKLIEGRHAPWFSTFGHLDAIGIGLVCAYLSYRRWLGVAGPVAALALFAATPLLGWLLGEASPPLSIVLVSLATALLLLSDHDYLQWAWLRWFGQRCYALYLLHQGVLFWTAVAFHVSVVYQSPRLVAAAVLLLLTDASWRYLEAPCIALGQRVPYRRAGPGLEPTANAVARPDTARQAGA